MINKTKLSTQAKHMISLNTSAFECADDEVASIGLNDFNNYSFRMDSPKYLGNSNPNELLDVMSNAFTNPFNKQVLLLLSDGKDSMSLALALNRAGIKAKTLTFLRNGDDALKNYVKRVSLDLGHEPYFVNSDDIYQSLDSDFFIKSCKNMTNLVMDQGYIYFLFGLKLFFDNNFFNAEDYIVYDGLGNDETFGYLPSKNQLRSFKLSLLNLWKYRPRSFIASRWYLRSPAESHGDLSALACFFDFPLSFDINKYFSSIPKSSSGDSFVDFRAFSRGSFHDHQCMMGKTRTACSTLGCDIAFPWLDHSLKHYVFNLPRDFKYNLENWENKLILRNVLSESIEWSQSKRGVDLYFDLDEKDFLRDFAGEFIPNFIINKILDSVLLPSHVKKRASLELANFYGFCLSKGMSEEEISSILGIKL